MAFSVNCPWLPTRSRFNSYQRDTIELIKRIETALTTVELRLSELMSSQCPIYRMWPYSVSLIRIKVFANFALVPATDAIFRLKYLWILLAFTYNAFFPLFDRVNSDYHNLVRN